MTAIVVNSFTNLRKIALSYRCDFFVCVSLVCLDVCTFCGEMWFFIVKNGGLGVEI